MKLKLSYFILVLPGAALGFTGIFKSFVSLAYAISDMDNFSTSKLWETWIANYQNQPPYIYTYIVILAILVCMLIVGLQKQRKEH